MVGLVAGGGTGNEEGNRNKGRSEYLGSVGDQLRTLGGYGELTPDFPAARPVCALLWASAVPGGPLLASGRYERRVFHVKH